MKNPKASALDKAKGGNSGISSGVSIGVRKPKNAKESAYVKEQMRIMEKMRKDGF